MHVAQKEYQAIFSERNLSEIHKVHTALQEIELEIGFEETVNLIIQYDVSPRTLSRRYAKFFEEYFGIRDKALCGIMKQFFLSAHELDKK